MTLLDVLLIVLLSISFLAAFFGAAWPAVSRWIDGKNKQAAKFAAAGAVTITIFLMGTVYLIGNVKSEEPQCPHVIQQQTD
ncbi:hypothetical protein [uncultured Corynebacterium sp.]|uniref:hypothetical protein n=1 Tax=uncultured Corynebacterium sp. TaxID=159447 RepID=UPI0025CE3394|nr:hypothetical protein [uncultured Corynebacterium sp.]